MITIASFLDAVAGTKLDAPVVLSPEALLYAERYFRRHGEELATVAIAAALVHFREIGARATCSPSELAQREKLLAKILTDTQPLLEPVPAPLPRFFSQ